jgi:hypothetical protein
MDVDHPKLDHRWDDRERSETPTERLDRNWSTLLQELRVTQTGVQLLTGFLLTLPLQQRFDRLDDLMRAIYVATVACSLAATIALLAFVAMWLALPLMLRANRPSDTHVTHGATPPIIRGSPRRAGG